MDDLTFRRIAIADPECTDANFIAKKEANQSNHDFVEVQKKGHQQLKLAMNVEIPDNLKARILLNHALNDTNQQTNLFKIILPMVASLFLVIVLFFSLTPQAIPVLGQSVLSHIYQEKGSLLKNNTVNQAKINQLFAYFKGRVNPHIGKVVHATLCDVQDKKGIHLVIEKNHQLITLILLPTVQSSTPIAFADQHFKGKIIPSIKGSMVIVTKNTPITPALIQQFKINIHWLS